MQNLENTIQYEGSNSRKPRPPYKSLGEDKIAKILETNNFNFIYEKQTPVIDTEGKQRKLKPDFYLTDYDIYIEYLGRADDFNYMLKADKKMISYTKACLKVVYIYPQKMWKKIEYFDFYKNKNEIYYQSKQYFEKHLLNKINKEINRINYCL